MNENESVVIVVIDTVTMPNSDYPSEVIRCAVCGRDCWLGNRSAAAAQEMGITLIPKCITCSGATWEELIMGRRIFD